MTRDPVAWRLLPLAVHDGPANMAIDEAMLEARGKDIVPPTVRLYQWSPSTVTIGKHQSVDAEVDRGEISRRGFQLVRRISGGGAVLHAEGMELTYAIVARRDDLCRDDPGNPGLAECAYTVVLRAIQGAIKQLSVQAMPGVVHCPAVLVDGKKVSGNAQRVKGGTILQHGTMLLAVDPDVMYSVLKPPAGASKSRMVQSVRARVTGIETCVGRPVDPGELASAFTASLASVLGARMTRGTLTGHERDLAGALVDKYASDAWTVRYP